MKLGVVGSRKGISPEIVSLILDDLKTRKEIDEVISGGAHGVDTFAARWAKKNGIEVQFFSPDWKTFGKSAGAIRNQKIVDESDELIIFWNGESKGTEITIKMVKKAGKPFHLFTPGSNPGNLIKIPEEE